MRYTALALAGWIGCGGGSGGSGDSSTTTDGGGGNTSTTGTVCTKFVGTCVDAFFGDCWDPVGTCTQETQGFTTTITYENGAYAVTTGTTTELYASTGTLCWTAESAPMQGGCLFQTTYSKPEGGDVLVWCVENDQSMTLTCPNGDTLTYTPEEAQESEDCKLGADLGSNCDATP